MAKKQVNVNETAAAAGSVKPARAASTRAPRVTAAQHSKTVSPEPATAVPVSNDPASENSHEAIAKIAYGFWESRGGHGGSAVEDWTRAEQEYRQRMADTRQ